MAAGNHLPGNVETIDLQQQIARLQALLEASRQVHSNLHEEEVLQQVLRILVRELEMAGAAFPGSDLAYGDAFSASDAGTDATSLRSYPLEDRDGQRMTEHLILTQIRVDLARSLKQRLQTRDLLL